MISVSAYCIALRFFLITPSMSPLWYLSFERNPSAKLDLLGEFVLFNKSPGVCFIGGCLPQSHSLGKEPAAWKLTLLKILHLQLIGKYLPAHQTTATPPYQ